MESNRRLALALLGVASLFLLVILAFSVASSGDDRAIALEGPTWVVDRLVIDGVSTAPIEGTSLTSSFGDGVSGTGGCNQYTGDYRVDGDRIAIGPLASTMAFCDQPPGVSDQESSFLSLLQRADTFVIDDGRLALSADGEVLVELVASAG